LQDIELAANSQRVSERLYNLLAVTRAADVRIESWPERGMAPSIQLVLYHCPDSTSPSPTTRRSNLLINSALRASAAFMAVVLCFKVLLFDP
jgi:hypothetical protein